MADRLAKGALQGSELRLYLPDGTPVVLLPPNEEDGFHIFLSHTWADAQDVMGTLKGYLCSMIPSLKAFLDVRAHEIESFPLGGDLSFFAEMVIGFMISFDLIPAKGPQACDVPCRWMTWRVLISLRSTSKRPT